MHPDDPAQPPSIFKRPPDDAATGQWARGSAASRPPQPPPVTTPPSGPTGGRFSQRQQVVVLGAMGLAIVALSGFIGASLLRGNEPVGVAAASATPNASGRGSSTQSVAPSPTPVASSTPTPVATATPLPVPVGPLADMAAGWSRVVVELNVRGEPSLTAASARRLVQGAVLRRLDGPREANGYRWYRVASLGGAEGWIASGTEADPYVEPITSATDLIHCAPVSAPVLADGAARDPIRIGDLAFPASAFRSEEIGALELLRATREDACVSAQMAGATARLYTNIDYYACGGVEVVDGNVRLVPRADIGAMPAVQVKDVAILHPGLITRAGETAPTTRNLGALLAWTADDGAGWTCVSHGVHETATGSTGGLQVDARACGTLESREGDRLTLRGASGDAFQFTLAADSYIDEQVATAGRTGMMLWLYDAAGTGKVDVSLDPDAPC